MIYLVEDDDEIRTLEEYALKSAGFTVQGFSDGDAFQRAMEENRPSLVILDVMLPARTASPCCGSCGAITEPPSR